MPKKNKAAKKQQTITKAFARKDVHTNEELVALEKEVEELRKIAEEKQRLVFQARREALRNNPCRRKRGEKTEKSNKTMHSVAPVDLIYESKIRQNEEFLELYSLLTGTQVESYIRDDHCCVSYNICVNQIETIRHGVQIRLDTEVQVIENYSLPIGFRLKDVTSKYKYMMERECLLSIHRALLAYYDRLEQINLFKEMVPYQVKTFHSLDGLQLEISALLFFEGNSDKDSVAMLVNLSYGVQDTLPTQVKLVGKNLNEVSAEVLRKQCATFQTKPLRTAFLEAFMKNKKGHYVCLREDRQAQPNISPKKNQSKLISRGNKKEAALTKKLNNQDKGYSSDSFVSEEED